MSQKWYDVQDEQGTWRVGEFFYEDQNKMKMIGLDGFHSNFTSLYCQHSDKILPIRTKTMGLTVPSNKKPLRQAISLQQLQKVSGRLQLYLIKPNLLQFDPKLTRSSIRTQFLVMVDKILTTPYEIIREIKIMEAEINKFFCNLLSFYSRILNSSKIFSTMESNESTRQLYKSIYELSTQVTLILGIHPHSTYLYDSKLNINIKPSGFIDYLFKSDGISPFRQFMKQTTAAVKQPTIEDMKISLAVVQLFLELFQKGKSKLMEGQNQAITMMMIDDTIANLRHLAQNNQEIKKQLATNLFLISKIEAVYFKLRPNKQCPLRKHLIPKQQSANPKKNINERVEEVKRIQTPSVSQEKVEKLEERIKKLQQMLIEQKGINSTDKRKDRAKQSQQQVPTPVDFFSNQYPTQNLGEELFLSSIQWALQCGNVDTAKKLVKWRKSLLQVGRVVGWQVALIIGCRTFKKAQITAQDIIQANYQMFNRAIKK